MFFVKPEQTEKQELPDPFKNKVKCEECKHYIDKSDAQEVKIFTSILWDVNYKFYCPMHRRPYSRIDKYLGLRRYFNEMEVTEEGEPIGYIKKSK
jgi:hypothetical protein